MIIKYFYDDGLAQASYLVGCAATGEALVVDPNRSVRQYIDAARAEKLRITHVTETHIHADYVSGVRELASHTGAQMLLSDEGGPDWSYGFARADGAVMLKDGAEFNVGNVRLQAVHTPGHTPEHMCFVVTDTAGADAPMGVFTGDFIFVGDVGRPDLLEKAAGVAGTMESAARDLFRSLQRFRDLPEWLQLWPGHGAGSACGKSLGAVPNTTLGYELRFNWAFGITDEHQFADTVLAGQPEPPKYFAQMKRINRDGPRVLGALARPDQAPAAALAQTAADGLVIDTRRWAEYRRGFVPGTINIPLNRSFTTWAGWLIPYDADFHVIAAPDAVDRITRDLAMIGLDRIAGWFASADVAGAGELDTLGEITPAELQRLQDGADVAFLDVRGRAEYDAGHIPGTPNIPLGHLTDRLDEIPAGDPVVVHCEGGSRSAIAASIIAAHTGRRTINLAGGYTALTTSPPPMP